MKCFILILQFLCLYESVCDAIALNANLNLKLAIHNEMLNYLSSLIKVQTKSKNGVPSKSLIASLQNDSISSTINVDSDGFWVKFFHYDPKESFVASTHSFYFNRNYKANHELRNEVSNYSDKIRCSRLQNPYFMELSMEPISISTSQVMILDLLTYFHFNS